MTTAIVGRTGSGKTFAAKGLIEFELDTGARVCVVDPTGVHWGLRLSADGESPGFAVLIFGGEHADVPISADQGERLGELVAGETVAQCVVDISEMTGGEQTRFLTAFLETLYAKNRTPLRLVLDEADVMAPQNPLPDQRRLQGATNKIVRRGRVKGFQPIMITQRPAVLDKSVLSQIDTLIAMRMTSPQDRKAIEAWVQGNADADQAKEVIGSLASLPVGEGWYWAPAQDELERRKFPAIQTYDSGRTPQPGEAVREVKPLSQAGIAKIRAALQVVQAQRKPAGGAGTPALSGKKASVVLVDEIAAAEQRGYERGLAEGVKQGRSHAAKLIRGDIAILLSVADRLADQTFGVADEAVAEPPPAPIAKVAPQPDPKIPPKRQPTADGTLNSAARKMLAVLDTNPPVARSWTQVATLAGLKARGGHFNAGKKTLAEAGLITETSGLIRIAQSSAGAVAPLDDPAAVVELWAGSLSGAAPKILRHLFAAGGKADRERVAESLGMQPRGGHWNAAWKELRDNEIVTVDGQRAALTELFMPRSTR